MSLRRLTVVGAALVALAGTVVLLGVGLAGTRSQSGSPLVGAPAPELTGRTLDGEQFRLVHRPGTLTVVNLWASWCGPCREELPMVAAVARRADDDLRVVTVNTSDGPVAARTFLAENGAEDLLTVLDPEGRIAVAWGATGLPETFLVDGEGVIRARHTGPLEEEWLAARLEQWGGA